MYFCHLNSTLIWEKHREEGGKMTEEKKNQTGPDGFGFNLWNPQNILKPRRNLSLKQGYLKLYQKWNTEVMDRGACLVCLEERSSRGIKVGSPAPNKPNTCWHGHRATAAQTGNGCFSVGIGRGKSLRPDSSFLVLCSLHLPILIACSFWNSYFIFSFFWVKLLKTTTSTKTLQKENNQKQFQLLSLWEHMEGPTALRWIRKTEQRCLSIQ